MTNQDYMHILAIVDRSGSMMDIKDDMEGGLTEYFRSQGELPGKCLVDYVQFDTQYEVVFKGRNASVAKAVIEPRGMTALLDAIGKGVVEFGAKLRKMRESDRPGRVQVVVVRDGLENASREWTKDRVRDLIKQQEDKYSWDFVFLGTGFDAVSAGVDYGFQADKSLQFNSQNVGAVTATIDSYTTQYRMAGSKGAAFTEEDRKANA